MDASQAIKNFASVARLPAAAAKVKPAPKLAAKTVKARKWKKKHRIRRSA